MAIVTYREGTADIRIHLSAYKDKGDLKDANNFRPITILSCLGKLFTSILNDRLSIFLDESMLLSENQADLEKIIPR